MTIVPAADVTDLCHEAKWKLCATTVANRIKGAYYYSDENRCQKWSVIGNAKHWWDYKHMQEVTELYTRVHLHAKTMLGMSKIEDAGV